jgi:hypothetical protein
MSDGVARATTTSRTSGAPVTTPKPARANKPKVMSEAIAIDRDVYDIETLQQSVYGKRLADDVRY